jgi:hypothetical protein
MEEEEEEEEEEDLRYSGPCSNYEHLLQHCVYLQTCASVIVTAAMSDCVLTVGFACAEVCEVLSYTFCYSELLQ